jgi:hypothetical protein
MRLFYRQTLLADTTVCAVSGLDRFRQSIAPVPHDLRALPAAPVAITTRFIFQIKESE